MYSIKMRASKDESHISGAESIVEENDLEEAVSRLVRRALNHPKGKSDFINIKVEELEKEDIRYLDPLIVTKVKVKDHIEGFESVKFVLNQLGIDKEKACEIINLLNNTYNMRGAILLDINTLERLEPSKERGIRSTYMDFEGSKLSHLSKDLKYNSHFIEALALATKVANCPNIVGEVCYSDDPNYTAGYIASKKYGYIRISNLKELGDTRGGRIFLYDSSVNDSQSVEKCIDYIENAKVIVKDEINIHGSIGYKDFVSDKTNICRLIDSNG